ncbi:MAG TPA: phosphate acetyltransferase [Candidatus Coatesbacteria bacterium]|nr:phosphate acetyltransferase [Candidatus Coatesbacteria bacterium]
MDVIEAIIERARGKGAHLVLPEGDDERVAAAYTRILSRGIARRVTLVGAEEAVLQAAGRAGIEVRRQDIIDPERAEKLGVYATAIYERRRHKGMTLEEAAKLARERTVFGMAMVGAGDADACVSGCATATGHVIRAALWTIGMAPGIHAISSSFIMVHPDGRWGAEGVMIFTGCAVIPNPDAGELADTAVAAARTARSLLGLKPVVAMLSYSTKGSGAGPDVDRVREATELVREREPGLVVDGELQLDAALVPEVAEKKAPGSPVGGRANVLVFPDLDAGNIGYKITQRLGGATAIGPILQGAARPISDLSRGASVEDIIKTSAITISQLPSQNTP